MGKYFGTDGVRGEANVELTPELAFKLGRFGGYVLSQHEPERPRVFVARDTRISGELLESALVAGLLSVGIEVYKLGVLATPGVSYLVRTEQASAGVMISASHNPALDNGIKFFGGDGFKLADEQEAEIEALLDAKEDDLPRPSAQGLGMVVDYPEGLRKYEKFLVSTGSDLEGMKIAVCKEFIDVTDEEINKVVNKAIQKLVDAGAELVEVSFDNIDLCLPTYYLINYVEFFSATRKYDGRDYGYRIEDVCGEEVLRRIEIGSYISQKEFSGKFYKKALQARSLIRSEINAMLENVDLIVGPTVPKLPHEIGTELSPLEMYAYDILTVIANLAGIPAASIKSGDVDGIPVGLQIQAKPLDDLKIIKAMSVLENTQ